MVKELIPEISRRVRMCYPDQYYAVYIMRINSEEKVAVEEESEGSLENFAREINLVLDEKGLDKEEDKFQYSLQSILEIKRFKDHFRKYKSEETVVN